MIRGISGARWSLLGAVTGILFFSLGVSAHNSAAFSLQATPAATRDSTPVVRNGKIAFDIYHDKLYTSYVMDADGSHLHPLLETGNSFDSTWSPDGKHLAFVMQKEGRYALYVLDADGNNLRRLTDDSGTTYGPAWSPDGRQIVFVSLRDNNYDLYVVDVESTAMSRLTNSYDLESSPAWSQDGRSITFTVPGTHPGEDMYVMNADGTHRRLLTNKTWGYGPVWSHDGRQIAFYNTHSPGWGILAMNSNGTGVKQLVKGLAVDPAWSPNDRSIAYVLGESIWVMDADGNNQHRLTDKSYSGYGPTWSPDGKSIAFISDNQQTGDDIYVVGVDGTHLRRLTSNLGALPGHTSGPAWQPVIDVQ